MTDKYILIGREAVPCDDLYKWAAWFERGNRRVAETSIGDVRVSTVFLGMDHGWGDRVMLFETMIFGGEHDQEEWRYATFDEAEAGHTIAVNLVKSESHHDLP